MFGPRGFSTWRRGRPFVGAVLIVIAGVEMFLSTQLDIGKLHIQMGIEGFQATIIPIGFLLLGVLIAAMPQHRIFYGVIALALSLYSIVGVNLGGFLIGMLLSAVGGVLVVSWAPRVAGAALVEPVETAPLVEPVETAPLVEPVETAPLVEPVETAPLVEPVETVTLAEPVRLHAEFAPYSSLVAIAEAARSVHVAA